MKKRLCFVMAQLDFLVGDIEGNAEKIITNAITAKNQYNADLVIFPELALTGYPPEDLLFRPGMYRRVQRALEYIQSTVKGIDILLGYPVKGHRAKYNAAGLICNGEIVATYYKNDLPNYEVFDELRYFKPSNQPLVLDYKGVKLGLIICEDLWHRQPFLNTVKAGAELIISINASPFDAHKHEARKRMLKHRTEDHLVPILYLNLIGGQDELVFDGGSIVVNEKGDIQQRGEFFKEVLIPVAVEFDDETHKVEIIQQPEIPLLTTEERIYQALVLGVRDYIQKNHFNGAIIGLSGGIDSALTLAIAVDAIGAESIEGVLMPSRYTAQRSIGEALEQAKLLNVKTTTISIEPAFTALLDSLDKEFEDLPVDTTEQNLQARCRGIILMAISNKKGGIVLSTGNKSELSVGYSTLYGDMVGGFSVLKDIPKTMVYRLANEVNKKKEMIPKSIIEREPTAELAFNQKDTDSLPPYPILDQILELYIEQDESFRSIVEKGFDKETVRKIILMIDRNEYKRRQAPPGVRITKRAFGRDRRYPITSGYTRYLLS